MRLWCVAGALVAAVTSPALGENWPQWRGPRLDNVSPEKGLPATWSKEKNLLWRTALPGAAGSSPIVWDRQVFLTSSEGADLVLMSLATDTGRVGWKRVVSKSEKAYRGDEGNDASASPCTDGKHVWCFFGTGELACFTLAGEKVWQFNVQERYGRFRIQFGMASTPILHEGKLYLQLIHGDGNPETREAVVVCLSGADGSEVWKVERPSDGERECEHSYASPTLFRAPQGTWLITHGADWVMAHDLQTGKEAWRCGGMNPRERYNPTLRFVASPMAAEGLLVVPSAKGGPVLGLRGGKGDLTQDRAAYAWKMERDTPDVPSPLIHDGLVYLCRENGVLICLDAKTGEVVYTQRTESDRHRASPVYADGKVYLSARKGVVTVIRAGRTFEVLGRNEFGEGLSATPAISQGRLFVRTFDALHAIGGKD